MRMNIKTWTCRKCAWRRTLAACAWTCAVCLPCSATDPVTVAKTAVVAREGVPGLVRAGRGIVEVPKQVGQCLRLPLGLVEMVFSPFPEVEFMEGLRDTGKGLVAPFKLCMATLEMPYEVFGGLGQAITGTVD